MILITVIVLFFYLYSYFVIEKCIILISCVRNKVLGTYYLSRSFDDLQTLLAKINVKFNVIGIANRN